MRYIVPCLLASTAAMASTLDSRLDLLEGQMQELRMQTVYGNFGAKTATAYPSLNSWGLSLSAEAIYWKFFEGGTDYVFANESNPDANTLVDRLHYLDFDWRVAYRITLGYQLENPDSNLFASFTRFTTDQTSSVNRPSGTNSALFPNQATASDVEYQRASVKGILSFNTLDVAVRRAYFLRKNFSMNPFLGVRGALIDMRTYFRWEETPSLYSLYKTSNDFSGVGLVGGVGGKWHFSTHWNMFGPILASLLYGWYDVGTKADDTLNQARTLFFLDNDTRRVVPSVTTDFGFGWESTAFCDRVRFSANLAYEFQYWWAQNQTLHTKYNTLYAWDRFNEDLGMQGVKGSFSVDF